MALTIDQTNQLLYDAIDGKTEPSVPGDEAAVLFKKLKQQVSDMMAKGIMPMPVRD